MSAVAIKKDNISTSDEANQIENVSLGEIITVDNGRGFKKEEWRTKGIPIIRIQNLKNQDAEFNYFDGKLDEKTKVNPGDLLFAWSGTPGTSFGAHIWKGPVGALNQHIFNVRFDDKKFDVRYLCYAINQNVSSYVKQAQGGVGLAHITKGKFMSSTIPLMTFEQQKQIVAKIEELFSHIDAGIDALKQSKKLLKQYRQSVLKAAVTGELSKEWREQNKGKLEPASKLLERILQERRQKWEAQQQEQFKAKGKMPKDEGWKGKYEEPEGYTGADLEIPENWVLARAEQLCEFITKGTTPSKENLNQNSGDIPFIKVYNLRFDTVLDFTIDPIFTDVETHRGFLARSKVYPGDVLMNIVGPPLGKVSIVPDTYAEWNINQAVAAYRPINGVNNKLIAYSLLSKPVLNWMLKKTKTTAGQVNLTLEIVRDVPIPIMSEAEQVEIVRLVEAKLTSIDQVEKSIDSELHRSERLKQSVLQSAFGGCLI